MLFIKSDVTEPMLSYYSFNDCKEQHDWVKRILKEQSKCILEIWSILASFFTKPLFSLCIYVHQYLVLNLPWKNHVMFDPSFYLTPTKWSLNSATSFLTLSNANSYFVILPEYSPDFANASATTGKLFLSYLKNTSLVYYLNMNLNLFSVMDMNLDPKPPFLSLCAFFFFFLI